jgi:hypothetical protein
LLSAQQEKIFAAYATRNLTTLVIGKCIREISSSSDAVSNLSARKTRLALDYYCKIYLDGSICLHSGYGKMVVRKTREPNPVK